jgi:hypothetical protein
VLAGLADRALVSYLARDLLGTCGKRVRVRLYHLLRGQVVSCGCARRRAARARFGLAHGLSASPIRGEPVKDR